MSISGTFAMERTDIIYHAILQTKGGIFVNTHFQGEEDLDEFLRHHGDVRRDGKKLVCTADLGAAAVTRQLLQLAGAEINASDVLLKIDPDKFKSNAALRDIIARIDIAGHKVVPNIQKGVLLCRAVPLMKGENEAGAPAGGISSHNQKVAGRTEELFGSPDTVCVLGSQTESTDLVFVGKNVACRFVEGMWELVHT